MLNFVFNPDMDMNSIRRKNLRAEINRCTEGNVAAFARQFGIDEARMSQVLSEKYRGGKNFGEKAARAMEKAAGLAPLSLDKVEPTPEVISGKLPPLSERKEEFDINVAAAALGKRVIPVISAIQAGALKEITQPYEVGDGFAAIFTDETYSQWAFALVIEGHSMSPEFMPGDIVVIEPEWEPRPGEYVAAKNGREEATFKKYRPRGIDKDGKEVFELAPLNDDYPTLRSDTEHLRIIGVMAEHRRKARRR
jgi:SOS-response transcriptional repressor LexA